MLMSVETFDAKSSLQQMHLVSYPSHFDMIFW